MARMYSSSDDDSFFNLSHAKWVVRVLSMIIAAVGRGSLLGLILQQTRTEISNFVRDEEPAGAVAKAACYKNN